jgi:hypothetical protein
LTSLVSRGVGQEEKLEMDSDTIGSSAEAPADTSAAHKHPEFPDITSPNEASAFLNHRSVDDLDSQVDVSAGAGKSYPQRASLTTVDGQYQLTWGGSKQLDSKWDWVALVFRVPSGKGNIREGRYYLCAHPSRGITAWEWADNSNYDIGAYVVGSVSIIQKLIAERGGDLASARALYFVWKNPVDVGWYASTEPIEPGSVMTPGNALDTWRVADEPAGRPDFGPIIGL